MNDHDDDVTLLRRYAEEGSEAAFTELVRRYVGLVYSAAARRVSGDPHLAADVSQQVFTALARNARALRTHPALGAWLHTATRNAALKLMISDQRRRRRETAVAFDPALAGTDPAPNWELVKPALDASIDELPEADRTAVVLRFLQQKAFAEIGAALRISEDAARMRTERALDRLRAHLERRGIRSSVAALGALVATEVATAAVPVGLTPTFAAQAMAAAAAGHTLLSAMTIKLLLTASATALVAFGAGAYVGLPPSVAPVSTVTVPADPGALSALQQENARLKAEVAGLETDMNRLLDANSRLSALKQAPAAAQPAPKSEGQKTAIYTAVLNNLRQIDAARVFFLQKNGHPASTVQDFVGTAGLIRRLLPVDGEDYNVLSMLPGSVMTVTTASGLAVTYDPSGALTTKVEGGGTRYVYSGGSTKDASVSLSIKAANPAAQSRAQELADRLKVPVRDALVAYKAANNNADPTSPEAFMAYLNESDRKAASELLDLQKNGAVVR